MRASTAIPRESERPPLQGSRFGYSNVTVIEGFLVVQRYFGDRVFLTLWLDYTCVQPVTVTKLVQATRM